MGFKRYYFRLMLGIPLVWLTTTILFLQFSNLFSQYPPILSWRSPTGIPFILASPGLGEMGEAVQIDVKSLSAANQKKYNDGLHQHAFNAFLSDMISVNRTLPDVRDPGCRLLQYKSLSITASIIMCFHNEAWSVLLRSIHSILNRTPPSLLKEIILVDDSSSLEELKWSLDTYIKPLKIVKIIRLKERQGLIRSRLAGVDVARGDALVFLDSHIEVTEGWLEPLLGPISENFTTVITPIIEPIDDNTLKYTAFDVKHISVGGFDWNLQFNWHALSEGDHSRRKTPLEPARSPTMAGGLFAIHRQFFEDLGRYDEGMEIWGGENLEISFRIWMCGGTLLTAPCSHVGHIFRKRSPYQWLTGVNVVKKNSVRLAEVWLDDFKNYYYERLNFVLEDYGDVSSRKALRKRLKCQSFAWYLSEVYPEQGIPRDATNSGEVRSLTGSTCLDANTDQQHFKKPAIGFPCHFQGGNQFFMLTSLGEIRRDEGCLEFVPNQDKIEKDDQVLVARCHGQKGHQEWIYNEIQQLYHASSGLCLTLSADRAHVIMAICEKNRLENRWNWGKRVMNRTIRYP